MAAPRFFAPIIQILILALLDPCIIDDLYSNLTQHIDGFITVKDLQSVLHYSMHKSCFEFVTGPQILIGPYNTTQPNNACYL